MRLVALMLAYDVIGFQTGTDRGNFARFLSYEFGAVELDGGWMEAEGRRMAPTSFRSESMRIASPASRGPSRRGHLAQVRSDCMGGSRSSGSTGSTIQRASPSAYAHSSACSTTSGEPRKCEPPAGRAAFALRGEAYAALRRELEELAGHINGATASSTGPRSRS